MFCIISLWVYISSVEYINVSKVRVSHIECRVLYDHVLHLRIVASHVGLLSSFLDEGVSEKPV